MKKTLFQVILLTVITILLYTYCSDFVELGGVSASDQTNITKDLQVLSIVPESFEECEVRLSDIGVAQFLTNISDFRVLSGSMIVENIQYESGTNLILWVSNQIPGETVEISVPDIIYTNYSLLETNSQVISNEKIRTIKGGTFSFQSYGSDDKEPPAITLFTPMSMRQYNIFINNKPQNINVLGRASDNIGVQKIEYKIDDGIYKEVEKSEFLKFNIDGRYVANGTHTLKIRVTDMHGYTVMAAREFCVDHNRPNTYVLFNPVETFSPGDIITVKAGTSDITTVSAFVKMITPVHQYIINMTNMGGETNWSADYMPVFEDQGRVRVEFYTVNNLNNTNMFAQNVVFYEKSAVYVSKNGNDTNNGSINAPKASIQEGLNIAKLYNIPNVRVSDGDFNVVVANDVVVEGGYNADFSIKDPVTYRTRIVNNINANGINNFSLLNITGDVEIKFINSVNVTLSNVACRNVILYNSSHVNMDSTDVSYPNNTAVYIRGGSYNVIKNSDIHNSRKGIYIAGQNDSVLDSIIRYNSHNNANWSGEHSVRGGGMEIIGWGHLIQGCRIEHNTLSFGQLDVHSYGGGIFAFGNMLIKGNIITGNRSYSKDWGVWVTKYGWHTEYRHWIHDEGFGGGLYGKEDGVIMLENNLISGNVANKAYNDWYIAE